MRLRKENKTEMILERTKKRVISKQLPTPNSIACGPENPASLGCVFYNLEDGEVGTFFEGKRVHEGQLNIVHGGLSAAVLDELMGRSAMAYGRTEAVDNADDETITRYVTAEMTVKYKKPVLIGTKIFGFGRVHKKEGRRIYTSAELINEDGELLQTGEGIFVEVKVSKDELTDNLTTGENIEKLSKNDPKEL